MAKIEVLWIEAIVRRFLGILLFFSILAPASPAEDIQSSATHAPVAAPTIGSSTPNPNTLLDGTPVKLRLSRDLCSAKAKVGERVDFEVAEEVQVNGTAVIATGALASGVVTEAHRKRRMARGENLALTLNSVRLVDGETAAIAATAGGKGDSRTGEMLTSMAMAAVFSFAGSTVFLLMHGNEVTIPEGTEITAYIYGNVPLEMAKFAPLQAAVLQSPLRQIPATELTFTSSPDDADVELDHEYLGSTSLVVRVKAGDHTVRISKKGYQPFEKKVHAEGGSISVAAELTKKREDSAASDPITPILR